MEQDAHEAGENCLEEVSLRRTGTVIEYRKDAHEAGEDCLEEIPLTKKKGTGNVIPFLILIACCRSLLRLYLLKARKFLIDNFLERFSKLDTFFGSQITCAGGNYRAR